MAKLSAQSPSSQFSPENKERHQIYCYLVMSLLAHYWNPWKRGIKGEYKWIDSGSITPSQYLGHNIACIAVDGLGRVVDFDFNHNEIFNSSLEHAEARLLRRLFTLTHHFHSTNIFALPRIPEKNSGMSGKVINTIAELIEEMESGYRRHQSHYGMALRDVTIYTSLESCAQCSGMMALGAIKEVVYLQQDPGQNSIGNILFNLNGPGTAFSAPKPIPANTIGLDEFKTLEDCYNSFKKNVASRPFHTLGKKQDTSPSITSFLCTKEAVDVFKIGSTKIKTFEVKYPDWRPPGTRTALTNKEVLKHAQIFYNLATAQGRRATPQTR